MVLQTALKYFKSWAGKSMQTSSCKPHIVTTNVEHDAILLPLKHFEEEQQAGKLKILDIIKFWIYATNYG